MIETLTYHLCLLGCAGFGYKLIESRHSQPVRTMWFLAGFGICIAAGIVVLTPAMEVLAGPGPVFAWVAPLVGEELKLGAIGFAVAFSQAMWRGEGARLVPHALFTGATMVLLAACYALSSAQRVGDDTVFPDSGLPFALGDKILFLVYGLVSLGLLSSVFARGARHAEPGPLRAGLWLLVIGVSAAFVWTLWGVDDVRRLAQTSRIEAREDLVSSVLAAVTVGLIAAGATLSAWSPAVSSVLGRVRAYRAYRRIEPLWAALRAAVPGIALDPGRGLAAGPEFALYRRVIEIRDGHLALRAHFDPGLPARAAAEARRAGVPEAEVAATVEAVTLAAAIEAERAGRRFTPADDAPEPLADADADVAAEADWLVRVSRAWRRGTLLNRALD
ncbi:MAB_1171c family putative transporter [Amycolatopsis sp., V23-08]|uniref:MAB_1171c family putative transporter n=1 Tax=Amycolatopsis heterodermiae TaxID=3110235 RepID=A0ABU5REI0_9PSEU|nr:MAB_1171c family putative transporter [Amycolatopsis sp., V23-08]MEA5364024.1 MAB_1171c family putative transporter [Amycolatopsis sp., V23-08]